jgi:hypothetical protein
MDYPGVFGQFATVDISNTAGNKPGGLPGVRVQRPLCCVDSQHQGGRNQMALELIVADLSQNC